MKLIIEADFDLTGVEMHSERIDLSYEGDIGQYGRVFFTHRLTPSDTEESKGSFQGFARTVLPDGGSVRGNLSGVWCREGADFRIHSLDDAIGLPDQNYVDIRVNLLTKKGSLRLFSLNED